MTDYVKFTEKNDWEGETWHFYIPTEGNEDELTGLKEILNEVETGTYELDLTPIPDAEVDVLVKHTDSGYMAYHNKLAGLLMLTPEILESFKTAGKDPFYKGGIGSYMRNVGVS